MTSLTSETPLSHTRFPQWLPPHVPPGLTLCVARYQTNLVPFPNTPPGLVWEAHYLKIASAMRLPNFGHPCKPHKNQSLRARKYLHTPTPLFASPASPGAAILTPATASLLSAQAQQFAAKASSTSNTAVNNRHP